MSSLESENVGKAVAARVGTNVREVRTKLGWTQARLAAPEYSISYISAIERGKIRPSLKALSILARRLDVPLTFLLEGSPAGAAEARAVGYSPADSGPDQRVEVDLLQAAVLVQQRAYEQAAALVAPLQPERITTDQAYQLYLLRGQIHIGECQYQEGVVDLRSAVSQGEALGDIEAIERARNLLGLAYSSLYNHTLAAENHQRCHAAIVSGQIADPLFALDVLHNLADDFFALGDLEKAVGFYRGAIEVVEGLGQDSKSHARKYMEESQRCKASGKLAIARDYAMRSLALYEMRDQQRLLGFTHLWLGKTLEKQDKLGEAEQQFHEAICIEGELHDEAALSQCSTTLAELLLKRGNAQEAEKAAQEAFAFAANCQDVLAQGQALIVLAQIRYQAGDSTAADQTFEEALDLIERSQVHNVAAGAYFRYASLLEKRGEVQRSLTIIKKAWEHQGLSIGSQVA